MTFSCFASMTGPTSHSHSFKAIKRHSRLHQCNSLAKEMRFRGETAIKARLLESFALFPPQNLKRNYQNYQTLNPCLRQPFSFWNLEQLQSKQDKQLDVDKSETSMQCNISVFLGNVSTEKYNFHKLIKIVKCAELLTRAWQFI